MLPAGTDVYGVNSALSAGSSIGGTVPAVIEDDENGVRYVCKGYDLYVDGNLSSSGDGNSYEGAFPSGANDVVLSWVWEKSYKFTISAGENGTVEPSGENWITAGSQVVITATPASEAQGFYCWQGDCPETSAYTASITLIADKPRTLAATFGSAWYVSRAENASDENNGNSPDAPFATLTKALEMAADGDAIWIGDGTYTNGAAVTISKAIAVRSVNGAEKTIFDCKGAYQAFTISNADAYLGGITILNGSIGSWNFASGIHATSGGKIQDCIIDSCSGTSANTPAVLINSGWISRSIVRNGIGKNASHANNAAIETEGFSLIEDCVVTNNQHRDTLDSTRYSGNIWCRGGQTIIKNTLIADNRTTVSTSTAHKGTGLSIEGWTHIENCTIANNLANGHGGGIYSTSLNVILVNTILDGNTSTAATSTTTDNSDVYGTVGFVNSLSSSAITANTDGNLAATANFADANQGDYRLASSSLARDAGCARVWQENGFDLGGTNRILGAAVDIGAYEYIPAAYEPLACTFTIVTKKTDAGLVATFTATVVGSDTENLSYTWNFGDGTIVTGSEYGVVSHTYTEPNTYTVTLSVSNGREENAEFFIPNSVEVIPETCYVSNSGRSIAPYHTWENAATNLSDALSILCSRIEVDEGVFHVTKGMTVLINRDVTIVGKGADKTIFDLKQDTAVRFRLEHDEAVLSGVTIRNGSAGWNAIPLLELYAGIVSDCIMENAKCYNCGPVFMQGGHLVNCVIRNTSNDADNHRNSTLYLKGGTVENCIISNNVCKSADCTLGTGIYVAGDAISVPVIRNCLIADNKGYKIDADKNSVKGGAGVMVDKKAILENCTIAGNIGSGAGIGLYISSSAAGTVVTNCIVADNIVTNPIVNGVELPSSLYADATSIATNLYINAATYDITTSCSPDLGGVGTDNITVSPRFRGRGNYPYSLRNTSPCMGRGTVLDWMADGAHDLSGNPRLIGTKPEIGAYEIQGGAPTMMILQ